MSALSFTDQRDRLRRIVVAAVNGTTFVESHTEEAGRIVVLTGSRPDGDRAVIRFLAVRESKANQEPQAGAPMRLKGVGSADGFSLLRLFFPFFRSSGYARVRIDAGQARLDITCQDAEWWQEAPATS